MSLTCPRPSFDSGASNEGFLHNHAWSLVVVLVTSVIVLFYGLGVRPIELWDESRLANNAIEMAVSGYSLITTFDWQPDHWNTKPPLLIWLMSASLRSLGLDEFSVRLPSAVAALCTTIVLWVFVACRLRRPLAGCLTVLLLLATPQYVHGHGARSGNYESLLGLLTTGYLLAAYLYLRNAANRLRWLALAFLLAFLAFMTKTVQAFLFIVPITLFAIPTIDRNRLKELACGMTLLLVGVMSYYVVREQSDPGYIAAAVSNDILGRYGTVIENHSGNGWFYLHGDAAVPLLQFGLLASALLAFVAQDEVRIFSRYLFMAMVGYLGIISSAGTKLVWYIFPLLPLAAAGVALFVADSTRFVFRRFGWGLHRRYLSTVAMVLGSVFLVSHNLALTDDQREGAQLKGPCDKFLFSDAVREASKSGLAVFHPGYGGYHAPTLFYTKALDAEGGTTTIVPSGGVMPSTFGYALTCNANGVKHLERSGRTLETIAGADYIRLLKVGDSSR